MPTICSANSTRPSAATQRRLGQLYGVLGLVFGGQRRDAHQRAAVRI
jgi:hypothetical protein